jgi:Dimerisation domain
MSQHDAATIRKPRSDDRALMDVVFGLYGYPAVLLAHRLKLFPLLAEKPQTLPEICVSLHLAQRPASALLSVCTSLGFIQVQNGNYSLTAVAEDYLLD